jgi:DNA-binding CsgD family transcriptional regulator
LSQSDCARLLSLTGGLYSSNEPGQLTRVLLTGLLEAIPCEFGGCHLFNLVAGWVAPCYHPWRPSLPAFNKDFLALVASHPLNGCLHEHPLQAWKESDVISTQAFRRSAFYTLLYRPIGIDHELTARVPCGPEPGRSLVISLHRRRKEFSDRDRLFLNLLLPHFARAHDRCHAAAPATDSARALFPDLEQLRECVRAGTSWSLSARETEVLFWLGRGKNNVEIGLLLGISARTAETHALRCYRKMGVENRYAALVELLNLERRHGLT